MSYQTDLTDSQWEIITSIQQDNRQRKHSLRMLWNAIFYVVKTGCQWRMLPQEFPPWQTVYYYYGQWRDRGVIEEVHARLRASVRQAAGRDPSPSMAVADSQSVKTDHSGPHRGIDGGKGVKGRKRHMVVDMMGLVLAVMVGAAKDNDKRGVRVVLQQVRDRFDRLRVILVDGGYKSHQLATWVHRHIGCRLELITRTSRPGEFQVVPKRWVVERTFAWFNNYRRLSKDYEFRTDTSETMIYLAMIRLMLNRLA